uniref:Uncharacterized protein LOC114332490 n=1 Tax=Diabrotica virgifera virgifera TaxID=50390 RepID=A0A6P7G083_DIAVI
MNTNSRAALMLRLVHDNSWQHEVEKDDYYSITSEIEFIGIPQQYVTLIREAKKTGKPFEVKQISYADFYDFKALQKQMGANFDVDGAGQKHKFTEIKIARYERPDY